MATYEYGGWVFGVNLQNLLNEALYVHAAMINYDHLGADSTAYQTRVSEFVNQAIADYLRVNPSVGISTEDVSVSADTQTYDLPVTSTVADYLEHDITKIIWDVADTDEAYAGKALIYLSQPEIERLPATWLNGDLTTDYPPYWGFDSDGDQFSLYPCPSMDNTLTVYFRPKYTLITQANVNSPSAVSISEIPTLHARILALHVASKICSNKPERAARLWAQYQAELKQANKDLRRRRASMGVTPRQPFLNNNNLFASLER